MYFHLSNLSPVSFFDIFSATFLGIIVILVFIFLKYYIKRYRINQRLPGPKYGFFDIKAASRELEELREKSDHRKLRCAYFELIAKYKKEYGQHSFFSIPFAYITSVMVFKAQAIEELINGTRTLKKAFSYDFLHPWLGTGLLTSFGQKWKSRRKLLTPSFHFDILKEFLPVFNEQSQKLVESLKKETSKDSIDIVMPVTLCSLDIICETTLGVQINAQENEDSEYVKAVLRAANIITERQSNRKYWLDIVFRFTEYGRQLKKDIELLHKFTRSIIQEKKQKYFQNVLQKRKRKALMDVLLEHHMQTKQLSEEDIREEVDTFTFEGHDTTSMGISWAFYLIGLHKDIQEKLHDEMDRIFGYDHDRPVTIDDIKDMEYLDLVLKESQRLYPSVPIFARETTEDIEINGYKIPKGVTCNVLTYFVHRDEEVFPDPEKFDPDRFLPENSAKRHPFAYIPFSAGPRNCIGQRFAQMEVKVVVSTVLRHFKLESLDSRDKIITIPELILRSLNPIRIRIRPRNF